MNKDSIILDCENHREDMLRSDIKYLNNKCEILKEKNANLKQALNEIREYIKEKQKAQYKFALSHIECDDILQIIDKVLGDEK